MDEEIETLIIGVRADTRGFARDIARMRGELEGPLAAGLDRAGRTLENGLARAIASGRLGFEDLRRVALSVLADIGRSATTAGLDALFGTKGGAAVGAGGLGGLFGGLLGLVGLGLPGRATGGPVSAGRGYVVGERGPEIFVPPTAGRIEAARGGPRDIRITVNVAGGREASPARMARSGRQIARAVRAALVEAD